MWRIGIGKMSRRRKRRKSPAHVDSEWISERIGGHGGSYDYNKPDGIVKIHHIGSTPKRVIWLYNLQLLLRYFKRKLRRIK